MFNKSLSCLTRFFVGNDRCGDLHENGYFPLRKCVVNVFLLEMRDRGDLTEEWAMIPVTKKHQNILPESQLVTKKHRRFFDVFSWQTENRGDVTKNSDFLLEKMVVHGQFLSTSIKLRRCDDSHSLINFKIVVSLVV